MTEVLLLGRRAVREISRYPEATNPTLFIPLFMAVGRRPALTAQLRSSISQA